MTAGKMREDEGVEAEEEEEDQRELYAAGWSRMMGVTGAIAGFLHPFTSDWAHV